MIDDTDSARRGGGFVRMVRSDETLELMRDPLAFTLVTQIAYRARWKQGFNHNELAFGEALIGDNKSVGLSPREYRTRLAKLKKWQFVTTKPTSKGTIVTLVSFLVFDIRPFESIAKNDEHGDKLTTNKRRTANERATSKRQLTNKEKKGNNEEEGKEAAAAVFPEVLATESFKSAWADWETHRKERKKPVTPMTRKALLSKLQAMGPDRAIAALRRSIENGWIGIFEETKGHQASRHRVTGGSNRNTGTANEKGISDYSAFGRRK